MILFKIQIKHYLSLNQDIAKLQGVKLGKFKKK